MICILQRHFPNPPGNMKSHTLTQMVLQNRDDFLTHLLMFPSFHYFPICSPEFISNSTSTRPYHIRSRVVADFTSPYNRRLVLNLLNKRDTELQERIHQSQRAIHTSHLSKLSCHKQGRSHFAPSIQECNRDGNGAHI